MGLAQGIECYSLLYLSFTDFSQLISISKNDYLGEA